MKVLIACEFSGVVRDQFSLLGHDATSCDLIPSESAGGKHYQGNVLDILNDGWDLMIAHPPCTFLTSAQAWTFNKPDRFPDREKKRQLAIEFVEQLWSADIPRIVIENPVGFLSTMSKLGKATQIIQPYEFGDDASKKTCLWLKGLPMLKPTQYFPPRLVNGKKRWSNQTDSGQNRLPPADDRAKDRAKTYMGIAQAMAEQWGKDQLTLNVQLSFNF